jgi:Zn-dependent protease
MNLQYVNIVFELIVFLFAISIHESAHAWMANRCGDPTARMLGRITLNPIKHIDPLGTILLPAVAIIAQIQFHSQVPVIGWAKPTPVNPRNFKNPVLDDILTSVVGPASNFLVATIALILLMTVSSSSTVGYAIVHGARNVNSPLVPITLLLFAFLYINVVLGVFNLIPVPPLDGSHVLRHFLSGPVLAIYDRAGFFALLLLVYLGGGLLDKLITPVLNFFVYFLR